jgi:hypothetical protein
MDIHQGFAAEDTYLILDMRKMVLTDVLYLLQDYVLVLVFESKNLAATFPEVESVGYSSHQTLQRLMLPLIDLYL